MHDSPWSAATQHRFLAAGCAALVAELSWFDGQAALWVIERVYLLAWTNAASDTSPFAEFVEHWTAPEFAAYVDGLGALATPEGYDELIAEVLSLEVAFWDMALEWPVAGNPAVPFPCGSSGGLSRASDRPPRS